MGWCISYSRVTPIPRTCTTPLFLAMAAAPSSDLTYEEAHALLKTVPVPKMIALKRGEKRKSTFVATLVHKEDATDSNKPHTKPLYLTRADFADAVAASAGVRKRDCCSYCLQPWGVHGQLHLLTDSEGCFFFPPHV